MSASSYMFAPVPSSDRGRCRVNQRHVLRFEARFWDLRGFWRARKSTELVADCAIVHGLIYDIMIFDALVIHHALLDRVQEPPIVLVFGAHELFEDG